MDDLPEFDGVGLSVDVASASWVAVLALSAVGGWLADHPLVAYWVLAPLHLVMLPWMGFVVLSGGRRELEQLDRGDRYNVGGWAGALHLSCGFMVPLWLGLVEVHHVPVAWFLIVLIGPFVGLGLTLWALIRFEDRSRPMPESTPRWIVVTSGGLALAYLTALESALWAARGSGDEVLSSGPLFFGIATLGYLPTRLFLHTHLSGGLGWRTAVLVGAFGWMLLQLALS